MLILKGQRIINNNQQLISIHIDILHSLLRLLLRTPGPVPFETCICSNVETILT